MPRNSAEYTLTTLDTVPASVSKSGTVDIAAGSRWVVGTATSFKSDKSIVEGDWIFVGGELSRIERIVSDTSMYLEDPIVGPIVAQPLVTVKASRAREISLANIGGAGALINGNAFAAGVVKTYGETEWYGGAQRDFPDPMIVDASGTTVEVLIVY